MPSRPTLLRSGSLIPTKIEIKVDHPRFIAITICLKFAKWERMASVPAPAVRAEFARRLRALRAQRGYERARHFAKALGIEENRYTRYERAEVEPNLTLIFEICQKLAVTPNELMGYAEVGDAGRPAESRRCPAGASLRGAPCREAGPPICARSPGSSRRRPPTSRPSCATAASGGRSAAPGARHRPPLLAPRAGSLRDGRRNRR